MQQWGTGGVFTQRPSREVRGLLAGVSIGDGGWLLSTVVVNG
jgi:hypothetical protein